MKKSNLLVLLTSTFAVTACMTQAPAPVEYGNSSENTVTSPSKQAPVYSGSGINSRSLYDDEPAPVKKEAVIWGDKKVEIDNKASPDTKQKPVANIAPVPVQEKLKPKSLTKQGVMHEVIEGETLTSIAKHYQVTEQEIINANNLQKPYQLEELQIIKIPAKSSTPKALPETAVEEPVSVGDTLDIAPPSAATVPAKTLPVKVATVVSAAKFLMPVDGEIIANFGENYMGAKNNGINIAAPFGAEIHASTAGEVVHAGYDSKFGNLVIIKADSGNSFVAYGHMDDLLFQRGQKITQGQLLGHIGQSGNVTQPQLHFAVRQGTNPVDPRPFLGK